MNVSPKKPSSKQGMGSSSRSRMPPWTVLNFSGLILNLAIFSATVFTYQRILGSTHATVPCEPNDHGPPLALAVTVKQQSSTTARNMEDNDKDKDDPLMVAPPASFDPDQEFHIIFSTGCSVKQNWQSYVLYHSIMESGQNGHATRIASGCTPDEVKAIRKIHTTQIEPMGRRSPTAQSSRFHLHLTPEYGLVKEPGRNDVRFHYLNKPYGVAHWMEEELGYSNNNPTIPEHDETIIMLLDPDMIFLRPFVNDFHQGPEIWRKRTSYPLRHKVSHGFPFSQEYGYSTTWYHGLKDVTKVFPPSELPTPAKQMTPAEIQENYSTGPPYMATGRDFYKLVEKWRQLSIPVQREFPDTILAEMYAQAWAAAHLKLPHQQAHSFMVSAHFEEGFHLFNDKTKYPSNQMCRGSNIPMSQKPHILHYCQRYAIGKYILGKHRLPQDFVGSVDIAATCASPLLAEPPTNISVVYDFFIDPDNKQRTTFNDGHAFTKQDYADRISFMLCEMIGGLNRAATYFKEQHCASVGAAPNLNKSLIFHNTLDMTPEELSGKKTNG
ncbi:expressed unknown protein [Seminavis robusta]|uniref:Uncharacterized protein n=1 Tax=Seminavis robusta TaxID=568900 RepID=A0A9N8EFV8_9STRA|nr:expressed unknown protein [Seminavis robusta]|eukprot:Sro939_g222440.1 n/a (552) ;mRNA; f:20459-22489